jgi:hypothetical protein
VSIKERKERKSRNEEIKRQRKGRLKQKDAI